MRAVQLLVVEYLGGHGAEQARAGGGDFVTFLVAAGEEQQDLAEVRGGALQSVFFQLLEGALLALVVVGGDQFCERVLGLGFAGDLFSVDRGDLAEFVDLTAEQR